MNLMSAFVFALAVSPDASPAVRNADIATAEPLAVSAPATLATVGPQLPASPQEWQRQYDTARARRKSGLKKVIIGLAMGGAGVAMAVAGTSTCANSSFDNDCAGSGTVATVGVLTSAASAVPFWWGVIQWVGANGDVRSLEATRPAATGSQAIRFGDRHTIQFAAGLRPSVAYKVSW